MARQTIDDISKYAAPHRDRWHYLDFSDGKHKGLYTEWKYFNFVQNDVSGYVIYYVLDPELRTPLGSGRIMARILRGGNFHGGIAKIPMDKIEFDTHTASARFGDARLEEKTPHEYDITGSVAGVSWKLGYKQDTPTLDGFSDTNFGILPWEKVSWLVKMPRARVAGTISIDGVPMKLNALGYSDTNWGEFLPLFSRYEWAQFNDKEISVVLGAIYRLGALWRVYAYAEINKEVIHFDSDTFKVLEKKWGKDAETGIKMPVRTHFEIRKGPYTLDCAYAPARTDMLSLKVSPLLPKPCVSEQISEFAGTLRKDGGVLHSFTGMGFSEYAPKTWKNTAVTF